jgi:hypothetical protein
MRAKAAIIKRSYFPMPARGAIPILETCQELGEGLIWNLGTQERPHAKFPIKLLLFLILCLLPPKKEPKARLGGFEISNLNFERGNQKAFHDSQIKNSAAGRAFRHPAPVHNLSSSLPP